jgi:flagellar biosynthesis/type III secretory pathway protein FliH
MAINTDGQKKIGRFLKKGSRLLSCVHMVDFNFNQITDNSSLGFDNPDRSIINTRFHDPEVIERSVKTPDVINTPLVDAKRPKHGVIFPSDFTQDWYNERLNKNKKRRDPDDDEDDEYDFVSTADTHVAHSAPLADLTEGETKNLSDDNPHSGTTIPAAESANLSAQTMLPEDFKNLESSMAQKLMNTENMSAAISKAFDADIGRDNSEVNHDNFTPLPTESENTPVAAEDRAIENWKNQQLIAKQNEQILEDLKAEARSEGYQSGFREGEEKGLLSGQKKAAQVFSKVDEIINEFEGLKSVVLDNVQKNFYELSQAIAEALLGREFSIKPEAYATMIQRVIKDTIAPNEFKVKMHPDTWQRVHDLGVAELTPHLVKDTSIPIGEFRVESSLTVVDVSAKKLVQQLLEKADINLFDDKKAG